MGHTDKHSSKHVNGEDDIQNATAAQKGLATDVQITKLDGIAAGAIANVIEDTTPQLGGDLDLNGKNILNDMTNFANYEIYEHFLQNDADTVATRGGDTQYGKFVIKGIEIVKENYTTLKQTSGAVIGNDIYLVGNLSHNPNDYTYYQYSSRWKIDSVNIQNEFIGVSNPGQTIYAVIKKGTNAGSIKFVTTADNVTFTTTDNIVCDILTYKTYKIMIKNGEIKLHVDDVLKATHATNIPFDVPEGIVPFHYLETSEAVARDCYTDYINVQLGRPF